MITEVKPINLSQTQIYILTELFVYSKVMFLYFYLFIYFKQFISSWVYLNFIWICIWKINSTNKQTIGTLNLNTPKENKNWKTNKHFWCTSKSSHFSNNQELKMQDEIKWM